MERLRAVGVYDRPHPLRTRKIIVPAVIAAAVVAIYAVWMYFTL